MKTTLHLLIHILSFISLTLTPLIQYWCKTEQNMSRCIQLFLLTYMLFTPSIFRKKWLQLTRIVESFYHKLTTELNYFHTENIYGTEQCCTKKKKSTLKKIYIYLQTEYHCYIKISWVNIIWHRAYQLITNYKPTSLINS